MSLSLHITVRDLLRDGPLPACCLVPRWLSTSIDFNAAHRAIETIVIQARQRLLALQAWMATTPEI